jgi:hypothetical protein
VRRQVERVWAELEQSAAGDLTAAEQSAAVDVLRRLEQNLAATAAEMARRT